MSPGFLLLAGRVDKILLLILHDHLPILYERITLQNVLVGRAFTRLEAGLEAGVARALRAGDLGDFRGHGRHG